MDKKKKQQREMKYSSAKKWAETGAGGGSWTSQSYKIPPGVNTFYFPEVGTYKVDIIPYWCGAGNPDCDEGWLHHSRKFYAHGGFGPDGREQYVCPQTFGERCPICVYVNKEGESDFTKRIRQKLRVLWNLIDRTSADSEKRGIQLWETAFYKSFGVMLQEEVLAVEDYENFCRLDCGYTLHLRVKEDTFAGHKFRAVSKIDMVKRAKPLPESLADQATVLDDILIKLSYKELERVLRQNVDGDFSDEEEEEKTSTTVRGVDIDDDDDDAEEEAPAKAPEWVSGQYLVHDDFGRCLITKINAKGLLTLRDEDDEMHKNIDPGDPKLGPVEEDDGDDEVDDEDDDKDDDDEWDD